MNKHTYIAIMAGGIGSRFWPKSREDRPKQFLDILGTGESLLQSTFKRFKRIVPESNIFIITGERYVSRVRQQLPSISDEQIVAEPQRRNTGPCICYMAHKLKKIDPRATFVVAPSDHLITEPEEFDKKIGEAVEYASNNTALVTLGIKPRNPHTGYGYIQHNEDKVEGNVHKVKTFTEKPSIDMAKTFLKSGDFLWNAGIFIWSVENIIAAFEQFQPDINEPFAEIAAFYNTSSEAEKVLEAYSVCKNISIDYAIMEHAQNVFVIPSVFGWSDLGTWSSLWEHHEKDYFGNAVEGKNVMVYESENCMVMAPEKKLVILQGLQDYCVIDTEDVLLICKIDDEQRIKEFNNDVRSKKGNGFQ